MRMSLCGRSYNCSHCFYGLVNCFMTIKYHIKVMVKWSQDGSLQVSYACKVIAKRIVGAKPPPPSKSGALMIEMWNLALTNSFCCLTLLKALVSSLSVHVHLISCFRALWEIKKKFSPRHLLAFTFSPFSIKLNNYQ